MSDATDTVLFQNRNLIQRYKRLCDLATRAADALERAPKELLGRDPKRGHWYRDELADSLRDAADPIAMEDEAARALIRACLRELEEERASVSAAAESRIGVGKIHRDRLRSLLPETEGEA